MRLFILSLLLFPTIAIAAPYATDYNNSHVVFSGKHAGNIFTGEFNNWTADIEFDGDKLDKSHANITFQMDSAATGNKMYDGALPTPDWFDVKKFPSATFKSQSFKKNDNGYQVTGDLTIKDVTKPVTFDFTLSDENPTHMTAEFPINRLDYNIGMESDADAQWVDKDIIIKIDLMAAK